MPNKTPKTKLNKTQKTKIPFDFFSYSVHTTINHPSIQPPIQTWNFILKSSQTTKHPIAIFSISKPIPDNNFKQFIKDIMEEAKFIIKSSPQAPKLKKTTISPKLTSFAQNNLKELFDYINNYRPKPHLNHINKSNNKYSPKIFNLITNQIRERINSPNSTSQFLMRITIP